MPWRRFSASITPIDPSELERISERLLLGRHDVVTRQALLASGVTLGQLHHALRTGRLHPHHAGVYARGRRELSWAGKAWAGIAACGPSTALGGRAAGIRWGMLTPEPGERLALTTTGGSRPRGIDVRRTPVLPPALILDDLPVLSPHATLIELAGILTAGELARALAEAEINRLVDHAALRDELVGRRRVRPLVELLANGPRNTRSPVEDLVLPLVEAAGLPAPERNVQVHGWWVDFVWLAERVVLEVDSWTYHATGQHYERDARKQAELEEHGFDVIRRTRRQVEGSGMRVMTRVARGLESASKRFAAA